MTSSNNLLRQFISDPLPVPLLFAPKRFSDPRGWFSETYNERALQQHGITCGFVQDNQSHSLSAGTIRGLHYQCPPFGQAKVVRVLRGRIFDVAVDIRIGSPTYGKFVAAELSADNGHQLYVPVGFAHGFCTLEDHTEVLYKVSAPYSPAHEGGIRWDDANVAVDWPTARQAVLVSDKDAALPSLQQMTSPFTYAGGIMQPLALAA